MTALPSLDPACSPLDMVEVAVPLAVMVEEADLDVVDVLVAVPEPEDVLVVVNVAEDVADEVDETVSVAEDEGCEVVLPARRVEWSSQRGRAGESGGRRGGARRKVRSVRRGHYARTLSSTTQCVSCSSHAPRRALSRRTENVGMRTQVVNAAFGL